MGTIFAHYEMKFQPGTMSHRPVISSDHGCTDDSAAATDDLTGSAAAACAAKRRQSERVRAGTKRRRHDSRCTASARRCTRAVTAAAVGTALEWFDFTLYGALAATVLHRSFSSPRWIRPPRCSRSLATFGVGLAAEAARRDHLRASRRQARTPQPDARHRLADGSLPRC